MATEVSESEAIFLDDAARTISRLSQQVIDLPDRAYLDFGSAWGNQFPPFYDAWQALYDRGRYALAPGGEAWAQFVASMNEFNKAIGRAQNAEEGWKDALWRFVQNPLAFQWQFISGTLAPAIGEGTRKIIEDNLGEIPWGKILAGVAVVALGAAFLGSRAGR